MKKHTFCFLLAAACFAASVVLYAEILQLQFNGWLMFLTAANALLALSALAQVPALAITGGALGLLVSLRNLAIMILNSGRYAGLDYTVIAMMLLFYGLLILAAGGPRLGAGCGVFAALATGVRMMANYTRLTGHGLTYPTRSLIIYAVLAFGALLLGIAFRCRYTAKSRPAAADDRPDPAEEPPVPAAPAAKPQTERAVPAAPAPKPQAERTVQAVPAAPAVPVISAPPVVPPVGSRSAAASRPMQQELEQLQMVKYMFEQGLITREEYDAKRRQILGLK